MSNQDLNQRVAEAMGVEYLCAYCGHAPDHKNHTEDWKEAWHHEFNEPVRYDESYDQIFACIEARGWTFTHQKMENGNYAATVFPDVEDTDTWGGACETTGEVALCSAFLAACEATKEIA
jgi:hypothetical protein